MFFCLALMILAPFPALGTTEPVDPFASGVKLFQEGRFVDSMNEFSQVYSQRNTDVAALYNWGLGAFKVEQRGLALGLWRRALSIDPEYQPTQRALQYARTQMPDESFAIGDSWSDYLKQRVLRELNLDKLLLVNFLLLGCSGGLFLRYLGERKKAIEDELPLPQLSPFLPFFIVMLLCSSISVLLKFTARNEIRATIIAKDASLRTAPSADGNSLFPLIEGVEVLVEKVEPEWLLVESPAGISGWVERKSALVNFGGGGL